MPETTGILFVCMGNICRSPLAEGLFLHLAQERGLHDRFRVDSAGTGGWHAGNPADPRTIAVAKKHGVPVLSRARQVNPKTDFIDPDARAGFHWLIGMDLDNCERIIRLGAPEERVRLLRSFDPALAGEPRHRLEVPDPYYGGPDGFDLMYEMIHSACEGLLSHVSNHA